MGFRIFLEVDYDHETVDRKTAFELFIKKVKELNELKVYPKSIADYDVVIDELERDLRSARNDREAALSQWRRLEHQNKIMLEELAKHQMYKTDGVFVEKVDDLSSVLKEIEAEG